MTRRPPPPGTQAVQRAIRLLKLFTESEPERTLQDLSLAARLTKTTAHRLLAVLESQGFVERGSGQSAYRLGPAVVALGVQALRTSDLRAAFRPALASLAEETGETATLEVLSDGQMLILDEVSGRHMVAATADIGTRWPIHATSTGKALLAAVSDEQRRALLKAPLKKFTASTITSRKVLIQELAKIREQGYAIAVEELEIGYSAVGGALRGATGDVLGAVSVGGPTSRLCRSRLAAIASSIQCTVKRVWTGLPF